MNRKSLITIVFIGSFPPNRGRLSEFNEALVKSISDLFPIKFIVLSNSEDGKSDVTSYSSDKIEVAYCYKIGNPLTVFSFISKIRKLRKSSNILVLSIYHGIFGKSAFINGLFILFIYLSAYLFRYKIITILHTLPELISVQRAWSIKINHILQLGLKLTTMISLLFSTKVIFLSKIHKNIARTYYSLYNSKIVYLPHGTWVCNINRTKHAKYLVSNKITIAYLGLIGFRKNLELLLDVMANIIDKYKLKLKLKIIGGLHPDFPTESKSLLINLYKKYNHHLEMEYLGYIDTKRLYKIFKNIDIVVLPYKTSTGTSGVYHLIARFGKPVVMPSFIEYKELKFKGAGIYLYNISSQRENLAEAITRVITDKSLYKNLSTRNIAYANSYQWKKLATKYLEQFLGDR